MREHARRAMKGLLYLLGGAVVVAATVFFVAWRSPRYYEVTATDAKLVTKVVPFAQYDSIAGHPRPYILRAEGVVVFGAEHTVDPDDPQIATIVQEWEQLRPTVALVEGRLGFLFPGLMDPVSNLGEGGKVRELAGRDGIPIYNWDLSKQALARQLTGRFEADQIAVALILNPYFSSVRFGRPENPKAYIATYLDRASYVGREEAFRSPDDVDGVWKRYFPDGPDWRDVTDQYGLPGYLGEMMAVNNDLRNAQLISAIAELSGRGERVFVICGSSHAACIAPALDSLADRP